MNKIKWRSDEEFIKKYRELKSSRKMGTYFNCSKKAVLSHAKEIGYDVNENKTYKLSEQDKQEIIKSYNTPITSTELAKKYNVSRGMITRLWYDNHLSGKPNVPCRTTEIDLTGKTFGKWKVLYKSNKRTTNGGIYWHCVCECGREKDVSSQSLRLGKSLSCGNHSNISKGNVKISKILDEYNIPYEIEKKFENCKDVKPLPFDFYVNNSYLIEYDGQQHYEKENLFDYEYTHKHDLIKSEWCKNNNIPLIRIPYTQYGSLTIKDLVLETSDFIE